jgi:hypothetical protein
MDCVVARIARNIAYVSVLAAVTGCGKSESPALVPASASNGGGESAGQTEAVKQVAHEFLDAVLGGDTQRATAQLSPLAVQRIREGGKAFAPPGMESATFRIGEVRQANPTQALVQCVLSESGAGQPSHSEEMCCMMRLVDGSWRVSGIAYEVAAGQPPLILDFENPNFGQSGPQIEGSQAQSSGTPASGAGTSAGNTDRYASPADRYAVPAGGNSEPHTAQDPFQVPVR